MREKIATMFEGVCRVGVLANIIALTVKAILLLK
jgi:hypothetical protein